jgi:hypothetical protein
MSAFDEEVRKAHNNQRDQDNAERMERERNPAVSERSAGEQLDKPVGAEQVEDLRLIEAEARLQDRARQQLSERERSQEAQVKSPMEGIASWLIEAQANIRQRSIEASKERGR